MDSQEFHKLWFPNQEQPNSTLDTLDGKWPVKSGLEGFHRIFLTRRVFTSFAQKNRGDL
jgi:hypothetical protein